ncbi:HNH endonuclease [Candidatus Neomarinimicrobiota bacterium]
MSNSIHVDYYLFERQLKAFRSFVLEQSGIHLTSFASNPYTEKEEGYKHDIYRTGREALAYQAWKESDIGKGDIISSVIEAIEQSQNNLVPWQSRFGDESRPHQPLYLALGNPATIIDIESIFFQFYRGTNDEGSFEPLTEIFGKTYPLIAYFYFLKDRSRYLPISPTKFDSAFELLGIEHKSSHRCSWENYSDYLSIIGELKVLLYENLESEISLLDAHSFCWILVSQMHKIGKSADVKDYLALTITERKAICKARVGQGMYRSFLLEEWNACAVTGVINPTFLTASHAKPWKDSTNEERLNPCNGLLLSPAMNVAFDQGYISFEDDGSILISERLSSDDADIMGIGSGLRLNHIREEHIPFLKYHRENIYN